MPETATKSERYVEHADIKYECYRCGRTFLTAYLKMPTCCPWCHNETLKWEKKK